MTAAPPAPVRAVCARCRRPAAVCYCDALSPVLTRTRLLLLQHPRESRVGIGTARMAHLGLPQSVLRVGTDFARDPVVAAAAGDPAGATYVLFPGPAARDVSELPRDRAVTLVVLDGTWSQARKLLRLNPALAALPRVAFTPRRPSEYKIRRQPAAACVSTVEALAAALELLEPEAGPFDRLLAPFHAMVARQERYATEVNSRRHARPVPKASRPSTLPPRVAEAWPNLVCVQGEANAWSARDPARDQPEIVHWVAHRPATGDTYEAVIAPSRTLAPATHRHVELPAERLLAGCARQQWHQSWASFLHPDDVLVDWGMYYRALAITEGLALPPRRIDLRGEVAQMLRERVGTLDQCLQRLGAAPSPLPLEGRGGRRLSALVTVVSALRARVAPPAAG